VGAPSRLGRIKNEESFGTSYVILRVADINRSVSFYRDPWPPLASSNGEIAFFTAGSVTLMIQQVPSPDTPSGGLAYRIVLDVRDTRPRTTCWRHEAFNSARRRAW
jgi:hypothetical protein